MNIIGLRNRRRKANQFDDELHVFYHLPNGHVKYHRLVATTDPGVFWLQNPMQGRGTAILKQGQYVRAYKMGLHRGKTPALVQVRPVTVLIDSDRNGLLNFLSKDEQTGVFGINIHPAFGQEPRRTVDRNSAGCQVVASDKDMELLLALSERHKGLYGNEFTYTLLDFRQLRNETIKRVAIGAGLIGTAVAAYLRPEVFDQVAKEVEAILGTRDNNA